MRAFDQPAGVPLLHQSVEVDQAKIIHGFAVDVREGRLPNTNCEHYLQIVLVPLREAILLPVTEPFLAALARQCERAAGIPQPKPDTEG